MAKTRTYVDTNVLIAAFQGDTAANSAVASILDDPEREFVSSPFLRLETLRKPRYLQRKNEVDFFEAFFADADQVPTSDAQVARALDLAGTYDISAMDALHAAAALDAQADEFVTLEQSTKPLFRITTMRMVSLHQKAGS